MVTICTTSLTFNNSTFCPHTVFMCFVCISEQTAIISLYNINWMVFITDNRSAHCAVRTAFISVILKHKIPVAPHCCSCSPANVIKSLHNVALHTNSQNIYQKSGTISAPLPRHSAYWNKPLPTFPYDISVTSRRGQEKILEPWRWHQKEVPKRR